MNTTSRAVLKLTAIALGASLFTSAALAAGSHGSGDGQVDMTFGQPGKAADVTRTIEVVMLDNYFEPEEIDVEKGETVRFVVTNEGQFVHEFNIGTSAMHVAHQEEMQMMMMHGVIEPDRINREMMHMEMDDGHTMAHDDPNSVLLEPGETSEIIWKFAESQGLEFACNIPGHYDAGMAGDINFVTKVTQR